MMEIPTQTLAATCLVLVPSDDHGELLAAVGRIFPGREFRLALIRGGWYRVGGVIDAEGGRVAENLREWLENECGGDVIDLISRCGDKGFKATRLVGKTIFLVAATGDAPLDFLQVEVEELQEAVDRPLIDPDCLPDDMEDVIDPVDAVKLEPLAVGSPHYRLRRAVHFATAAAAPNSRYRGDAAFRRFVDEWAASSAGAAERLSDHWVLTLLPYTDRFGEELNNVKPRPIHAGHFSDIDHAEIPRGSELARMINEYDRRVGYPMAWYFMMVANRRIPHGIAHAVNQDLMGAYAYLPARDIKILRRWAREPYSL